MRSRRVLSVLMLLSTAASCFALGNAYARSGEAVALAEYDAKLAALRTELTLPKAAVPHIAAAVTLPTTGAAPDAAPAPLATGSHEGRQQLIDDIKREIQNEMGLFPLELLRQRQSSFVELYATDDQGRTEYGTAGYLGDGYFITVKHAVMAPARGEKEAKEHKVVIRYRGKEVPARIIDAGDADMAVQSGDWAILRTRPLDLPRLTPDVSFGFDFAEPIVRLGNDYSKGIVLAAGYVGQKMANGLITCLTDGHPGVSGGGVLNREGHLVGIPTGRMDGDYRFSFILPLRAEMLRKVPSTPRLAADNSLNRPSVAAP